MFLALPIMSGIPIGAQEEATEVKRKNLFLVLRGNITSMADDAYSEIYGKEKITPEFKLALRMRGNIYLWSNFYWTQGSGEWFEWTSKPLPDPDIRWERTLLKTNYGLGVGYFAGLTQPGEIGVRLEVGLCAQSQKDTSQEYMLTSGTEGEKIVVKDSAFGGSVDLGGIYALKRWLFAEVSLAFVYLPKKIDDESVNWGGWKLGLGLGFRL